MGYRKHGVLLLVSGVVVLISISAIVMLAEQYVDFRNTYFREIGEETKRNNFFLVRTFKSLLKKGDLERMNYVCSGFQGPNPMVIKIIERGKGPIFTSSDGPQNLLEHVSEPETRKLFRSHTDENVTFRFVDQMRSYMIYHAVRFTIGEQHYILVMASKCNSVTLLMKQTRMAIIFLSVSGLLAVLAIAVYFFRNIRMPLNRLFESTSRIAAGELEAEIYIPRNGLIREIALGLSSLTEQLKQQLISFQKLAMEQEKVFDSLSEAVLVLDLNGNVLRFNRAAGKLFFPWCSAGSRTMPPCPEELLNLLKEKAPDGNTFSCRVSYSQGGEAPAIPLLVSGLTFNFGAERGVLLSATDISDFERLEAEHREFIAAISHEMKTPLTGIIGAVDAISSGALDKPEYKVRCLETLHSQASRLNTLLLNFLTLNSLEHPGSDRDKNFLPVKIHSIVRSAVEINRANAENRNIEIVMKDIARQMELQCDAQLLVQALSNLIGNAVFHSGSEMIEVEVGTNEDGMADFVVRDFGRGVPAEHREKIFTRFYRLPSGSGHFQGSGIGLAIVRSIALYHHGKVFVTDNPAGGAEFHLLIPAD